MIFIFKSYQNSQNEGAYSENWKQKEKKNRGEAYNSSK